MITEDYVSFEVAKLLKEKGYCNISNTLYAQNGQFIHYDVGLNNKGFSTKLGNFYEAPTHQMVLKWLREIHNLHIDIFIGITSDDSYTYWTYFITDLEGNMIVNAYGEEIDFRGESYEQTIEAAIKYCLTNLIK